MYCIVKGNAATEGDDMLLNYSAIIYLRLIRLCCYWFGPRQGILGVNAASLSLCSCNFV